MPSRRKGIAPLLGFSLLIGLPPLQGREAS
jgi:hypothetical protein